MRRFVCCCLLSAVCCLTFACKKEIVETKKKATNVHTKFEGVPTDLRNAKIKETLPIEVSVLQRSAMGSRLGPDGNVAESQDVFKPGEPVYVTMWLKESPVGLQTSVRFSDTNKKDVAWLRKDMHGEKVVTFKLDTAKLHPGEYHVRCYWGMNIEREYDFRIEAAGKKKR